MLMLYANFPGSVSRVVVGYGKGLANLFRQERWSGLLQPQIARLDALTPRVSRCESNFDHEQLCLPLLVSTIVEIAAGWLESSRKSDLAGRVAELRQCAANPSDLLAAMVAANQAMGVARQDTAAYSASRSAVRALTSIATAMKEYESAAAVPTGDADYEAQRSRVSVLGMAAAAAAANCPSGAWVVGDLSYQTHVPGDALTLLETFEMLLAYWDSVPAPSILS